MNQLETIQKTMALLEATGLNWEVRKEPLVHQSGMPTPFSGVFRYEHGSDTPTECLGSVKDRYTILQNYDLAETIVKATDSLNIETNNGGSLHGGRKVFLQARLNDDYVGKSDVKRWITCLNSHDGSTSISFGSTNTVVVCQNTFHAAHKEGQKFRHTASAQSRIDQAILDMRTAILRDNEMFKKFHIMAEHSVNENIVKAVIDSIFKVDASNAKKEEVSTRKQNQLIQFGQAYNIERDLEGDTLWGLFNAVTRYTNHMATASDRDQYLMVGTGNKINNAAYDTIISWLEERTAYNDFVSI